MYDYFRYCVTPEWRFCASQKDTIKTRYGEKTLRVFLLFPLFTEHNCAVIDVRVPAAQWSPRRNRSNQSDLVIPSPSAHGELLLIRPDHGPRAYPHAARDTSSLKGAAGPGEWRMREPKRSGVREWPAQASLNHLSDLRSCQLPFKKLCRLNLTKHPV